MNTIETALILRDAGVTTIPVDKEKRPLGRWKDFQNSLPDEPTLRGFFSNGAAIALVTGHVQCIDIDEPSLVAEYEKRAREHGLGHVWDMLVITRTPSGGAHLVFMTNGEPVRNKKLAQENEAGGYKTLIETRGKGGYILIPPSPGYVHIQGCLVDEGVCKIQLLKTEERDDLIDVARTFDKREPREGGPVNSGNDGGDSPGDDYDQRGDLPGLLKSHGWKPVGKHHWRRPGKEQGVSASLGHIPGRFYVFSTSTQFESEHVYRPWHVYAMLEHGGDYTAAARELRILGYGGKSVSGPGESAGQSKQEEPRRESVFFPASDFCGIPVPERQWLVDDLIPMNTVTLLSGDGGTGKSLLSLQLAVDGATNGKWLNREVRQGRTLFVTAEDDKDELQRRVYDISKHAEMSIATASSATLRSLAGEDALLATMEGRSGKIEPTGLYWEINEWMQNNGPTLVVLDTLADFFPGNENDRAQVRHFVGLLRGLAIRHSCAVLLLAHPSVDGMRSGTGTSGSTAWNNSVRSRLYMRRIEKDGYEENTDRRMLSTMKANYGQRGGQVLMVYDRGVFVPEKEPTSFERMAAESNAQRVFLKLLAMREHQGRPVSAYDSAREFANHADSEGLTKKRFEEAKETLFAQGKIREVEYKKINRHWGSKLEIVESKVS